MPSTNNTAATFTNRTFGVEIEFVGATREATCDAINRAGVPCQLQSYGHSTPTTWKIVSDASVPGGYEVVSPILSGRDGLAQTRAVLRAMLAVGCRVDRQCGVHVHVGASDLSSRSACNLVMLYDRCENELNLRHVISPSRRQVSYSGGTYYAMTLAPAVVELARTGTATLRDLANAQGGRYFGLNLQAFARHSTVEFRAHQGSIDPAKVCAWIILCVRMVEAAIDMNSEITSGRQTRRTSRGSDLGKWKHILVLVGLKAYSRDGYATCDDLCKWAGSYLLSRRAHFAIREGRETGSVPRVRGRLSRCLAVTAEAAA